jgi:TatD DNase family protein
MPEYSDHSMDLVDSHAHVDVSDFDADRDAMLARAQSAGVGTMLAIGNGPELEKLGAAIPYAEQHDWIYASVGIHPHEARHATDAHYDESRGAKSDSIITTIIRRGMYKLACFAFSLNRRVPRRDPS